MAQAATSAELYRICETMLVYSQLLVKSIERTTDEAIRLKEIATHLKQVFDQESTRERQYIETLTKYNPLLKELDEQYYALKDVAKNLIKRVQEDKDKFDADYQQQLAEFQSLGSHVYAARSLCQQRDAELQSLREAFGNGQSASALDQLKGEVARLEVENRKLAAEAGHLRAQVTTDENNALSAPYKADPESKIRGVVEDLEAKVAALERQLAAATANLRDLRDKNNRTLAKENGINHGLEERCHELMLRVENANPPLP